MSRLIFTITLCLAWFSPHAMAAVKSGTFVNPITDVAWQEIFPIKIAGITIAPTSGNYDTPDAASFPICVCPAPPPQYYRIGISVSFWEPARMIETVATPYYFPSIGSGLDLASTKGFLSGKNYSLDNALPDQSTFAQAHYLLFPVWSILGMLTDFTCVEHSGFDVAYITEIDPLWQDDEPSIQRPCSSPTSSPRWPAWPIRWRSMPTVPWKRFSGAWAAAVPPIP